MTATDELATSGRRRSSPWRICTTSSRIPTDAQRMGLDRNTEEGAHDRDGRIARTPARPSHRLVAWVLLAAFALPCSTSSSSCRSSESARPRPAAVSATLQERLPAHSAAVGSASSRCLPSDTSTCMDATSWLDRARRSERSVLTSSTRPSAAWRRGPARSARDGARGRGTRWSRASTCWCRPAPAPVSRSATWCPSLLHNDRVVVATATLALQHQLVERDIPALLEAASDVLGERTDVRGAQGPQQLRLPAPGSRWRARRPGHAGRHARGHAWVPRSSSCGVGRGGVRGRRPRRPRQRTVAHRPALAPGVGQPSRVPRARRSARTPSECFAERARERAMKSQLIVTNHSLLAIDAIEGVPMIPEYDVVVVDEAHELVVPGDAGRHRRAVGAGDRARVAGGPATSSTAARPTTCRRRRCAARCDGRRSSPAGSTCCPSRWPLRSSWSAVPPATAFSAFPKETRQWPRPMPPGSRRAAWSTRSARSPSGWSRDERDRRHLAGRA